MKDIKQLKLIIITENNNKEKFTEIDATVSVEGNNRNYKINPMDISLVFSRGVVKSFLEKDSDFELSISKLEGWTEFTFSGPTKMLTVKFDKPQYIRGKQKIYKLYNAWELREEETNWEKITEKELREVVEDGKTIVASHSAVTYLLENLNSSVAKLLFKVSVFGKYNSTYNEGERIFILTPTEAYIRELDYRK